MKTIILAFGFFFSVKSLAYSSVGFPGYSPFFANIVLETNNPDGSQDKGPKFLLEQMQVPTQNSMLGPGKVIQTKEQDLTFICATRNSGVTCSINLKKSENSQLDPFNKKVNFKVSGDQAATLARLFLKPGQTQLGFQSEDKKFSMQVDSGFISIDYDESRTKICQ